MTLQWEWPQGIDPPTRKALLPARRAEHLRAVLTEAAEAASGNVYLASESEAVTFGEAARRVADAAAVLSNDYGIRKGDRVAIASANNVEYALAAWAIVSTGAICVGLNGWWTSAELAYGLDLTNPALILADGKRFERLAGIERAAGRLLFLSELLSSGANSSSDSTLPPTVPFHEDDPALILFTSGTTGRPKGATLSHGNILHFGWAVQLNGAVERALRGDTAPPVSRSTSISGLPFFHLSGLIPLLTAPATRTKLVLPPPGPWSALTHLQLTEEHGVTAWAAVPTQYWRILEHPDFERFDLSTVHVAGAGGAHVPAGLIRLFKEKLPGVAVIISYGMTEGTGLATRCHTQRMGGRPGAVGAPQPTVELAIRDDAQRSVPEGQVGEIWLRSPAVFLGYWDDPAATTDALDDEGWYRTGDFGRIHHGVLHLESRMRDLIIRGGENIYPIEVENRLLDHPDIQDAAVVGIDHPTLGHEPLAFVVLRPGAILTEDQVRAWVAATLAEFKVPAQVEFRASLPYTDTGKVLKRALSAPLRSGSATAAGKHGDPVSPAL